MNQQLLTHLLQVKLLEQQDQFRQIRHEQVWRVFLCLLVPSVHSSTDASRIAFELQQKLTRFDSSDSQPKEEEEEVEQLSKDITPEESLPPTQVDLARDISHIVVPKYAPAADCFLLKFISFSLFP
jgi:hypothetical protein